MDFIVKLLFLSGKYITCVAGRTIIEIFNKSIDIHKRMSFKYEKAVQIIGPHNNMLELLNSHILDESLNDEAQFSYDNAISENLEDHSCNYESKVDSLSTFDDISTTYHNPLKVTVLRNSPTIDAVDVTTNNVSDNTIFDDLFDNYKTKENEEDIYTDVYSDLYINFDGKRNYTKNTTEKTLPLNNTLSSLEIVNPVSSSFVDQLQSSPDRKSYSQTSTETTKESHLQEPTINTINEDYVGDKKHKSATQNTPIQIEVEKTEKLPKINPLLSKNVTELNKSYGIYSESSPLSYYYKDMYMNEILSPKNSYFKSKTINLGISKAPLATNTKQEISVKKHYTTCEPVQLYTKLRKKRHKGCKTAVSKKHISTMSDTTIRAILQQETDSHFNIMDKNYEHFKNFETKLQGRTSRNKHLNYDTESSVLPQKPNHFSKFEHNLDKPLMKRGNKILSNRKLSSSTCDCDYEDLNKAVDDRIKLLKTNNRAFCKLERKITRKLIRQELCNFKSRKYQEIPYTLTAKCRLTKSDKFDIIERTKLIEINKKIFDNLEKEMKNIVIIDKSKCNEENLKQRLKETFENRTIIATHNSLFDALRNKIKQIMCRKDVACNPFFDEVSNNHVRLNKEMHGNRTEKHKCENFKIPISCRLTKWDVDDVERTDNLDKNSNALQTFEKTKLKLNATKSKSAIQSKDKNKFSNLSSETINALSKGVLRNKPKLDDAVKKIAILSADNEDKLKVESKQTLDKNARKETLADNNKEKLPMVSKETSDDNVNEGCLKVKTTEGQNKGLSAKKVDSKTATIAETLSELLDKPMKEERKKCDIEIGKNSIIINEPSLFEKFKQIILKNNITKTEQVKVIELKKKKSKHSGIKFNVPYQETKSKAKNISDLKSSETKEYQGSEGKRLYTTKGKLSTNEDNWKTENSEITKTKHNSRHNNVVQNQIKTVLKENSSENSSRTKNDEKNDQLLNRSNNIHGSINKDCSKEKLTVTMLKDRNNSKITKQCYDKYKDEEGDDEDYSVSKYPTNATSFAPKGQLKINYIDRANENSSCVKNITQNTYLPSKVSSNNLLSKSNVVVEGPTSEDSGNNLTRTPINKNVKISQISSNKCKVNEDDEDVEEGEDHSVSKFPHTPKENLKNCKENATVENSSYIKSCNQNTDVTNKEHLHEKSNIDKMPVTKDSSKINSENNLNLAVSPLKKLDICVTQLDVNNCYLKHSETTAKCKEGEDDEDYSVSKYPTNTINFGSKETCKEGTINEDNSSVKIEKKTISVNTIVADNTLLNNSNKTNESINKDGLEKKTNIIVNPTPNITKQSFDKFKDDEGDDEDYSVSKCLNFLQRDDRVINASKLKDDDVNDSVLKCKLDSNKGNSSGSKVVPQVNKLEHFLCRKNVVHIEYPKVQRNINKYDCLKYFNSREKYDINNKTENKLLNKTNYKKTLTRDISKISTENPPSNGTMLTINNTELGEQDNENVTNSNQHDSVKVSIATKKTESDNINEDSHQLQQCMDSNDQNKICSEAKEKMGREVDEDDEFEDAGETSGKVLLYQNKLNYEISTKEDEEEVENESQEHVDSCEKNKIIQETDIEITDNDINKTRHGKEVTIKFSDVIINAKKKQLNNSEIDSSEHTYEDKIDDDDYSVSKHSNITGDILVKKNSIEIEEMINKPNTIFKGTVGGSIINHLLEENKGFNITVNKTPKVADKADVKKENAAEELLFNGSPVSKHRQSNDKENMRSKHNNSTTDKTDCKSTADNENERILTDLETSKENLSKSCKSKTSKINDRVQDIDTFENKKVTKQSKGNLLNKFAFIPMNNSQKYKDCNATNLRKQKDVVKNDDNNVTQKCNLKEVNLDYSKGVFEKDVVKERFKKNVKQDVIQNKKCVEQQNSTVPSISKLDKQNEESKKLNYITQKNSNLELSYDFKKLDKRDPFETIKYKELNCCRLDELPKEFLTNKELNSANKKYSKIPAEVSNVNFCNLSNGSSTSIPGSVSENVNTELNCKYHNDESKKMSQSLSHKKLITEYPKTEYFDTTDEIDKLYNKNSASYDILIGNIQTVLDDDKRKNLFEKIKASTAQINSLDGNKSDDSNENANKGTTSKKSSINKLRNIQNDIYEKFPLLKQKKSLTVKKENIDMKRKQIQTRARTVHFEDSSNTEHFKPPQTIQWKMKYVKAESNKEMASPPTEETVYNISNTDKPESLHDRFPFLKKIPKPVFDIKDKEETKSASNERVPFGKYIVHNRPVYLNKSLSPNPIPKGTMWNTRLKEHSIQRTNIKESEKSVKTKTYKLESKQICTLGKHIPITYVVEDK